MKNPLAAHYFVADLLYLALFILGMILIWLSGFWFGQISIETTIQPTAKQPIHQLAPAIKQI